MMDRMDIINYYHIWGNKHPQTSCCGWIHWIGLKDFLQENPIFDGILSCSLLLGQSSVLPCVDSFGLFGFCDFVNACQCDVLEPDCCLGMFGSNRFLSSVQ